MIYQNLPVQGSFVLCFFIICKEIIIKCKNRSLLLLVVGGTPVVHFLDREKSAGKDGHTQK